MMQLIPEWKPHDSKLGKLRFKIYGQQRAFVRVSSSETQNSVTRGVTNSVTNDTNSGYIDLDDLM